MRAEPVGQLVFGQARDLGQRLRLRRQRQLHHRLQGGVLAEQHRLAHFQRQLVAHRADGIADLVRRLDQVLVVVEDDDDLRAALVGRGADLVHLRNALQRLLDPVDDLALDGLGRGAGVGDLHHQHRLLHVGQRVHAQVLDGEQPQAHQHDDDGHRR